jgi:UDP-2,4-diacetamido-2,4,6-trideoxy-beta-L-altropyranose hydrolase
VSTLIIRADATSDIGTGHVMRCIALAQGWQDKGGKVVFISHCESEALQKRITTEGFDLVPLDKTHPHASDIDFTLATLSKLRNQNSELTTWIVIDGYHFDADYQKRIKDAGYKLLWIDDYGHAVHYLADLILNQNISADLSLYTNRESYTQLLLGTRYALLRREFKRWQGWQREHPPVARKVLVTLGGGDPKNVTLKVIKAIKEIDMLGIEARIISGAANPHLELLKKEVSAESNMLLLINATNMPELMAWADIAIAAGGSTNWELAFMGLPSIIFVFARNQYEIAHGLHNAGSAINLGWYDQVTNDEVSHNIVKLLNFIQLRRSMSEVGRRLVDGEGSEKIVNVIQCGTIQEET